jgi:tetratricopeptide (TPR) repeat protein
LRPLACHDSNAAPFLDIRKMPRLSKPALVKLSVVLCLSAGHRHEMLGQAARSDLNRPQPDVALNTGGPAFAAFAGEALAVLRGLLQPLEGEERQLAWLALQALDAALPSGNLEGIWPEPDRDTNDLAASVLIALSPVDPRFQERGGNHDALAQAALALLTQLLSPHRIYAGQAAALSAEMLREARPGPGAIPPSANLARLRHHAAAARAAKDQAALRSILPGFADALQRSGHLAEATDTWREALGLIDSARRANPEVPALRCERIGIMMRLAEAQLAQGRVQEAMNPSQGCLAELRAMVAAEPDEAPHRHALAAALDIAGDIALARDEPEAALEALREALVLRFQLAENQPQEVKLRLEIAATRDRIGLALLTEKQVKSALVEFNEALGLRQAAAQADPENRRLARDVARSCDLLGDAMLRAARPAEALSVLVSGRQIHQHLMQEQPEDAALRQNLAACLDRIGDALMMTDAFGEALKSYRASLNLLQPIAAMDASHLGRQRNLALSHGRIARAVEMLGHRDEAIRGLETGRGIIMKLIRPKAGDMRLRQDLDWFDLHLKRMGRATAGGLSAL